MDINFKKEFEGKRILITGGAGSIGAEIVKQLIVFNPLAIRVLDINETALFDLEQELGNSRSNISFLIGDVRDKYRMMRAMENIDIVFHAAALKHVYLCEYNPFEAIQTNVIGTQNVIDACLNNNVKKMVFISTDKAVNPTNVMGASKLLGERLTIAANNYRGARDIIFSCVRFGNVLVTKGSVIPTFINQIKKGGPITITHPDMTRFIMSISGSINLILKASILAKGGEVFVLKMPSIKIVDLSTAMIKFFASKFGYKPEQIKTTIIGKRPGEKMHEELLTYTETSTAGLVDNDIIIINSNQDSISFKDKKPLDMSSVSSENGPFLSEEQLLTLINYLVSQLRVGDK